MYVVSYNWSGIRDESLLSWQMYVVSYNWSGIRGESLLSWKMYVVSYNWSGIRGVITASIVRLANIMAIYKKYKTKKKAAFLV